MQLRRSQSKQLGTGISPSNPDNGRIGNHIHQLTQSVGSLTRRGGTFPLVSCSEPSPKVNHKPMHTGDGRRFKTTNQRFDRQHECLWRLINCQYWQSLFLICRTPNTLTLRRVLSKIRHIRVGNRTRNSLSAIG
jgi:hypothetical protein